MKARTIRFSTELESFEAQTKAGRYNPGLVAVVRSGRQTIRLPLSAGQRDSIHAFRSGSHFFVLSYAVGFPYAGLQVFDASGVAAGEVFFQGDACDEVVGPRGLIDLAPMTLCKRLAEYVQGDGY